VAADYWKKWFKTGSGGNWNRGASHPEFDALQQQLAVESDPVKIQALVQRGAEILEEWSPMLALMHFTIIDAWSNYVKGHGRAQRQDLFNDNRFDTVWLDK
jgi:ABC-type transport system substrate-binding protein